VPPEGHKDLGDILCDQQIAFKDWFAISGWHCSFGLQSLLGITLFLELLCEKGIVTADFRSIVFARFVPGNFATFGGCSVDFLNPLEC
jgi:hypothetical protein